MRLGRGRWFGRSVRVFRWAGPRRACRLRVWLSNEVSARRISCAAWLETGSCTFLPSGVPTAWLHPNDGRRRDMVLIGIDPHKGSHTAVAIDGDETQVGELRLRSSKQQCDRLLERAPTFPD